MISNTAAQTNVHGFTAKKFKYDKDKNQYVLNKSNGLNNVSNVFSAIFLVAITVEKYDSMPLADRQIVENLNNQNVIVNDVRIKNPNNPVQLMDGKLLIFKI